MQHAIRYAPLRLGGKRGTDSTLTKEGRYDISSRLNLEHSSILCNPSHIDLEYRNN